MKNFIRSSTCLMVLAFLIISCSEEKIETPVQNPNQYQIDLNLSLETDWEMADRVLMMVNQHRTLQGLTELAGDRQYASAYAVQHTKYMIATNSLNHTNFDTRAAALKSRGSTLVGETIASGYKTADEVVAAWLNSEGHKQVLEGNYTRAGFGVLKNSSDVYYYTMLVHK